LHDPCHERTGPARLHPTVIAIEGVGLVAARRRIEPAPAAVNARRWWSERP